ncbi:MAG: hypothetical protein WCI55_01645 [Armatimonadota bacterium]
MKRFQLVVFLGLFSLALAQKPIVYKDNAKKPTMIIQGNQGFFAPGENFELSGNVQIKRISASGDLTVETLMTCAKASGNLVRINNKMEVDKVRMTGGIQFVQKGENRSTTASGDSAEYDLKDGLKEVNVNGGVEISFDSQSTRETKKDGKKESAKITSTMNTTSRSATLTFKSKLDDKKREFTELQSAVVRGPIQFNGTQLVKDAAGEKLQKVFAKADKMTFTISGESGNREVKLEGNLEFKQNDGIGEGSIVEGANTVVLQLNEKNEILKLRFKSESPNQVATTITKINSKGKKGGA